MSSGIFTSTDKNTAAVDATNTGGGSGIVGKSNDGRAISGWSVSNYGVTGDSTTFAGVRGTSVGGRGVEGWSTTGEGVFGTTGTGGSAIFGTTDGSGNGVLGVSKTGDGVRGIGHRGVFGSSDTFQGVSGFSGSNAGVAGESNGFHAIYGISHDPNNAGVIGINDKLGWGVTGRSERVGVSGESTAGNGVEGHSTKGRGVLGVSQNDVGVHGKGGLLAGLFEGGVKITGELYVQGNVRLPAGSDLLVEGADCAENFDVAEAQTIAPGTVVVLGKGGALEESGRAYDRRVAGVVSGAGKFRPGIVLDRHVGETNRQPVALVGKVYCKVDADIAPIEIGDMLTTSSTPGHAMRADDPAKSFGAVIGKALESREAGKGLLPILVCLQ